MSWSSFQKHQRLFLVSWLHTVAFFVGGKGKGKGRDKRRAVLRKKLSRFVARLRT